LELVEELAELSRKQSVVTAWLLCNGQFHQLQEPTMHLAVLQWQSQ
jgi:hypothetical protein